MAEPAEDKSAQRIRIASGMAAKLLDSNIVPIWEEGTENEEATTTKKFISVREFLTDAVASETKFNKGRDPKLGLAEYTQFLLALEVLANSADPKVNIDGLKAGAEIIAGEINQEVDSSQILSKGLGNNDLKTAVAGRLFGTDNMRESKDATASALSGLVVHFQRDIRTRLPIYNGLKQIFDTLSMDMPPLDEQVQRIRT